MTLSVNKGRAVALISLTAILLVIGICFVIWQAAIGFKDKAGLYLSVIMLGLGIFQIFFTIGWWRLSPKHTSEKSSSAPPREMDTFPTKAEEAYSPTTDPVVQSEPLLRRSVSPHTAGGRPVGQDDTQPFSPTGVTRYMDADKSKESLA